MGDYGHLVPGLVATNRDRVGFEHALHLRGHRVEHGAGWRSFRHQGRHAPQRRLLVGELLDMRARLTVGDRGGDELDEAREPLLRLLRQGFAGVAAATMKPHTLPSTTIGTPTVESILSRLTAAPSGPGIRE